MLIGCILQVYLKRNLLQNAIGISTFVRKVYVIVKAQRAGVPGKLMPRASEVGKFGNYKQTIEVSDMNTIQLFE